MAWLTEAEYLYWRDVCTGEYEKKMAREAGPGEEFKAFIGQYPERPMLIDDYGSTSN